MLHYFYTRWTFSSIPDGLDSIGPYHSTWITESTFEEMFNSVIKTDLSEHFIKEFKTKEEMLEYWNKLQ